MPLPASFRMPPEVRQAAALGALLLFLLHFASVSATGLAMAPIFRWRDALSGTAISLGPALGLLAAVWPLTGWIIARSRSTGQGFLLHLGSALGYVLIWHLIAYALFLFGYGERVAERARVGWFLWQSLWGLTLYVAAAALFTAYRLLERARQESAATAQAQALLARAELAALRSKLNPHFLFNTLHSILALLRKDPPRAEAALLRFSDLLRQLLEHEREDVEMVSLAEELDFTRDYLALEALRLGERLQLDWAVDEALLGARLPPLTLQPLVENAVRHAIAPQRAPARLRIEVARGAGGGVRVAVQDSGPGCEPAQLPQAQGLGLRTVARRLELAFGAGRGLHIDTRPGAGFHASFELPHAHPDL